MTKSKTSKGIVAVAMSGGVDSSVAAYSLLHSGYDVFGVTFSLWNAAEQNTTHRGTTHVYENAEQVAKHLGIPWQLVEMKSAFHDTVVDYYIKSLKDGLTPNPCLICNKHIKWKNMIRVIRDTGAEYLATGHYAKVIKKDLYELHKANDDRKDQSYFLSILDQEDLSCTLLPLGNYKKEEVLKKAIQENLPIVARGESQDLCFMGSLDQPEFIKTYAPDIVQPGEIHHFDGRLLGEHPGLAFFTIGQRKGIRLPHTEALYVIRKDINTNQLIVGEQKFLGDPQFLARQVHWIAGKPPSDEFNANIRIRYRAEELPARIRVLKGESIHIHAARKLRDITPGQAVVMYQDDLCLGMGFIE